MNIIEHAILIATEAHKGQYRKWGSTEDYIVHPLRCVAKAKELGLPEYVQAAMAVHDVLEDVAIPLNQVKEYEDEIRENCGQNVLDLVWDLTNPSDRPEFLVANPNPKRIEKWSVNLAHIKSLPLIGKICKRIDRNDNIRGESVKNAPQRWRQKYLPETRELYDATETNVSETQVESKVFLNANEIIGLELSEAIKELAKM